MSKLATSVYIHTKDNAAEIVVDGNEINDVISYTLEESPNGSTLKLEIAITGEIEVQR